ncbi:hypothetical protein GWK26_11750 [haloarchaeon 3A1-DGR]|uniref:Uncharacterized protein n=2 Tax=Halopenitus persicus TaxID=1048396 RepID=A0A1H3N343_9EURY|nr:hypothetical protein GWK26_11750 [haloarchaeon 3A1-DGR]SDY83256.1 hypothetical protein SAMN05216564_11143 [Halopenitus persicus]
MAGMAGRYGEMDYGSLTKGGVAVGAVLFAVGAVAELTVGAGGGISPTLDAAFLTMEFFGPLIALLSVLVFGIAMPLTE